MVSSYDFTSKKLLNIVEEELNKCFEVSHIRPSKNKKSLHVDVFKTEGVHRVILKPDYISGVGEAFDKISVAITPGNPGVKREDIIRYLEQLDVEDSSRSLSRVNLKKSSKLVYQIVGKELTEKVIKGAIVDCIISPIVHYAKNMGKFQLS